MITIKDFDHDANRKLNSVLEFFRIRPIHEVRERGGRLALRTKDAEEAVGMCRSSEGLFARTLPPTVWQEILKLLIIWSVVKIYGSKRL